MPSICYTHTCQARFWYILGTRLGVGVLCLKMRKLRLWEVFSVSWTLRLLVGGRNGVGPWVLWGQSHTYDPYVIVSWEALLIPPEGMMVLSEEDYAAQKTPCGLCSRCLMTPTSVSQWHTSIAGSRRGRSKDRIVFKLSWPVTRC